MIIIFLCCSQNFSVLSGGRCPCGVGVGQLTFHTAQLESLSAAVSLCVAPTRTSDPSPQVSQASLSFGPTFLPCSFSGRALLEGSSCWAFWFSRAHATLAFSDLPSAHFVLFCLLTCKLEPEKCAPHFTGGFLDLHAEVSFQWVVSLGGREVSFLWFLDSLALTAVRTLFSLSSPTSAQLWFCSSVG